jgi:hypothetical protein
MNNSHDEIKNLLKASRTMLSGKKYLNETIEIKKQYGILTEQGMQGMNLGTKNPIERIDVGKSIEDEMEEDEYETAETEDKKPSKDDMKQGYRISGGLLYLHGKDKKDIELTTDEKIAFQETMEEFVAEVSDLVEFNPINIYTNNVEWSGKLIDFDLEFIFSIGEESGIYIDGEMTKISDEFEEMIKKLKTYYQKFKSKWAKVLGMRKKTQNM